MIRDFGDTSLFFLIRTMSARPYIANLFTALLGHGSVVNSSKLSVFNFGLHAQILRSDVPAPASETISVTSPDCCDGF